MRRFRSRRQGRTNFRRARSIVRAVSGITLAKRVLLPGLTIPDVTAADWDNALTIDLLECVEAQDEEVESDGTAIADAPLYSRLTAFKLRLTIIGPVGAGSANVFRWLLYKKPDGEAIAGTDLSAAGATFHSSNDTPTAREVRKMTMAKGVVYTNSSTGITGVRIFISRAAMKRISPLRENDRISLLIAKDALGTTATLHGFGTLYIKANA